MRNAILRDFIEANEEIIDRSVLIRFRQEDKKAITEALNQIHGRSLRNKCTFEEENKIETLVVSANRIYAQVLVSPSKNGGKDEKRDWQVVVRKIRESKTRTSKEISIFMVIIPVDITAREVRRFFKNCGTIKDIILPRKRDKNGKRSGFIKTTSEKEAGIIINNAKEKEGGPCC